MAAYVACAIKTHRTLKADDLLTFALWCAAGVAGVFAFIAALSSVGRQTKKRMQSTLGYLGYVWSVWRFRRLSRWCENCFRLLLLVQPKAMNHNNRRKGASEVEEVQASGIEN
jgi:hypothetical protein